MTAVVRTPDLPTFAEAESEVERAEQAEGWLARCADFGRYLRLTREMAGALGSVLRELGPYSILEVCAGDGTLGRVLRAQGLGVTSTDLDAGGSSVGATIGCSATEALERYPDPVVLGSFVPSDAGVHQAVLASGHVRHYVVLGARLGGPSAPALAESSPEWGVEPLPRVSRWMITRHDAWLGEGVPILRRGEAWLMTRERGHTP